MLVNTDNDAPAAVDIGENILCVYGASSTGNVFTQTAARDLDHASGHGS